MKKQILAVLIMVFALAAIAQPPGAKIRKTAVHTEDAILIDTVPGDVSMAAISESMIDEKLEKMEQRIIEKSDQFSENIINEIQKTNKRYSDYGSGGNFFIAFLKNTMPFMPFVAIILIAFFWFRNNYRHRLMRQEMIFKYIDRGEVVPEWLTINENSLDNKEPYTGNRSNAKTFLAVSIIMACSTFVAALITVNAYGWNQILSSMIFSLAFGYATVYCFKQYIKRTT